VRVSRYVDEEVREEREKEGKVRDG